MGGARDGRPTGSRYLRMAADSVRAAVTFMSPAQASHFVRSTWNTRARRRAHCTRYRPPGRLAGLATSAFGVTVHPSRKTQLGSGSRAAVAGKTRCVRAGQGGDGAGRIHLANAMISLIGNEEIVGRIDEHTNRTVASGLSHMMTGDHRNPGNVYSERASRGWRRACRCPGRRAMFLTLVARRPSDNARPGNPRHRPFVRFIRLS